MNLTWCLSNNVGDAINVYLAQKITGHTPIYAKTGHRYIACGSIANWADQDAVIWGAGIANWDDCICPDTHAVALRGPRTENMYNQCTGKRCGVYGDPALLMPMFYTPDVERVHPLGIIPHYLHQAELNTPGVKFINVFDDVESVCRQIASCERIVSSSLHGLILAHAYGIPAAWFELSPIGGDGTKFLDYFESVGIECEFWDAPFTSEVDVENLCDEDFTLPNIDLTERLWEACPFK
jgi:hypothetical protein